MGANTAAQPELTRGNSADRRGAVAVLILLMAGAMWNYGSTGILTWRDAGR